MITPIMDTSFIAGQRPKEIPQAKIDPQNGDMVLRPSGIVLREQGISVAASVIERLAEAHYFPITLEKLRNIKEPDLRAVEALKHKASQQEHTISSLLSNND